MGSEAIFLASLDAASNKPVNDSGRSIALTISQQIEAIQKFDAEKLPVSAKLAQSWVEDFFKKENLGQPISKQAIIQLAEMYQRYYFALNSTKTPADFSLFMDVHFKNVLAYMEITKTPAVDLKKIDTDLLPLAWVLQFKSITELRQGLYRLNPKNRNIKAALKNFGWGLGDDTLVYFYKRVSHKNRHAIDLKSAPLEIRGGVAQLTAQAFKQYQVRYYMNRRIQIADRDMYTPQQKNEVLNANYLKMLLKAPQVFSFYKNNNLQEQVPADFAAALKISMQRNDIVYFLKNQVQCHADQSQKLSELIRRFERMEDPRSLQLMWKNLFVKFKTSGTNVPKTNMHPLALMVRFTGQVGNRQYWYGKKLIRDFHNGTDMTASLGAPVRAVYPGVVKRVFHAGDEDAELSGNCVVVEHTIGGMTFTTAYAHLQSMEWRVGQKVEAGDFMGTVGKTGFSTGPHLHMVIKGPLVPVWDAEIEDYIPQEKLMNFQDIRAGKISFMELLSLLPQGTEKNPQLAYHQGSQK